MEGPARLLVVDDNADAGRVIAKLLRNAGYEVAELHDQQTTMSMLSAESGPIDGVVASFTTAGTSAGLRLLDAIRNHVEPRVNHLKFLLVSDNPRQQLFGIQAGADALIVRPYPSIDLVEATTDMVNRSDEDRIDHRRAMIAELRSEDRRVPVTASVTPTFF